MITTRRSENNSVSAFGSDTSKGGVALLERKEPLTYKEFVEPGTNVETAEQSRARMQENLARLLNYDRYSQEVQDSVATQPVQTEQVVEAVQSAQAQVEVLDDTQESVQAFSDEDIRPTSTTMQFGDGDIESLRMDMQKKEEDTGKYRLNAKGKLVVVLYALVLTVVMALIAINTGVLASLNSKEQVLINQRNDRIQTLSAIETEIESVDTPEYYGEQAIKLGMIK